MFKAWRMSAAAATTECVADYFLRDGEEEHEVDRLRVPYDVSHWSRATDAVWDIGCELCRALGAELLVADARCASTRGWRQVESRSRNRSTDPRAERP